MKKLALTLTAWLLATSMAVAQIVTGSVPNTFVNGTIIDATQVNADYTYIINQVNANGAKNGVNSDITALLSLSTPLTAVQGGSTIYVGGTSAGTANAQTLTGPVPANFTLTYGKTIRFVAGLTNTGPTTLAVAALAATNIYKQTPAGLAPLTGGEIAAGNTVELFYDSIQYELINPVTQNGGFGALISLAASATPDIGSVPSHNVNLSGGPFTITSFGSSASTTYPYYTVRFNAANVLTNSASLNLLGSMVYRTTAAGDEGLYFYNGAGAWYEMAYFPAQPRYAPSMANQLYIRNNPVTPTTKIDVSAKELVMDNGTGANQYIDSYYGGGTCTIDFSVNGSSGLDTGVIAANTWYYIYATGDGSAGSNCLASTSATAPALPAGTPYKARLGAIRTSTAAATLWSFTQRGRRTALVTAGIGDNVISSGISGTCAGALNATPNVFGAIVPGTAADVNLVLGAGSPGATCVAPSGGTGTAGEFCAQGGAATLLNVPVTLNYNGTNTLLYCGSTASSYLNAVGWDDAVNAN